MVWHVYARPMPVRPNQRLGITSGTCLRRYTRVGRPILFLYVAEPQASIEDHGLRSQFYADDAQIYDYMVSAGRLLRWSSTIALRRA